VGRLDLGESTTDENTLRGRGRHELPRARTPAAVV